MVIDSIRKNLTKEDKVAEISLLLSADFERKKSIVVVEGITDVLFFNGKLSSNTDLCESFSGKSGVVEIVESFSDDRVIGICDKDYADKLDNYRLLYYDYCCLEMMLISNDNVFKSFYWGYCLEDADPSNIRNNILKSLKPLSIYRRANYEHGWGINFKGISFSKSLNKDGTLNFDELIMQIKKINCNLSGEVDSTHLATIKPQFESEFQLTDYLNITQGHDFVELCHEIMFGRKKGGAPSVDNLSKSLLCAYRDSDFESTSLYKDIYTYQSKYGLTFCPKH